MPQTHASALSRGADALRASSPTPVLDARLLLEEATGTDHATLIAMGPEPLPPLVAHRYDGLLLRRAAGEPVAYIRGRQEFYGRSFLVGPDVLIPRPETELLVDAALAVIPRGEGARILDLGTGSGCLAVTLLAERPLASCVAVDLSPGAGEVANANAARMRVSDRITVLEADFSEAPLGPFDVILSNPPYVEDHAALPQDVAAYEPAAALFAGTDGLDAVRRLGPVIADRLGPRGHGFVEIGTGQGPRAASILTPHFTRHRVTVQQDLAGHDRMVVITPL